MQKITDYVIVGPDSLTPTYGSVEKEVKKKIAEGFEPYGSLVADDKYLYQAMVKYEQEEVKNYPPERFRRS